MATIKDIAKAAGVSVSTVSHVINKTKYVSEELTEKVNQALLVCDTLPNFIQKKMPAQKKNEIIVISSSCSSHYLCLYQKVVEKLSGTYHFSFHVIDDSVSDIKTFIDNFVLLKCYCIIIINNSPIPLLKNIEEENIPCIIISDHLFSSNFPMIVNDIETSYQNLARHLANTGHNRVIFFYNRQHSENAFMFSGMKTYFDTLAPEQKIDFKPMEYMNRLDIIENISKTHFDSYSSSVVSFDSLEVLENALPFFNSIDFDYTNKFSLIGYNLQEMSSLFSPPITTVDYNYDHLTETLEKLLQTLQSGSENKPEIHHISPVTRHLSSISNIIKDADGHTLPVISELVLSKADKENLQRTKRHYTAAVSFHYTGRSFMKYVENGIRSIFQPLNISLTAVTDANNSPELQKKQLEGLLAMDIDIIFVYPSDTEYLRDTLDKIASSKTRLFLLGSYLPDNLPITNCCCRILCPENTIAYSIAYSIGEYMTSNNLSTVALLASTFESFYQNAERCSMIASILEDSYPNINTLIYRIDDFSSIYDSVVGLVHQYPATNMMYISWESPAISALKALDSLNRSDIAICTMDLDYEIAVNMASNGPVKLIYGQPLFEFGQALAIAAIHSLLGNKLYPMYTYHTSVINRQNLLKSWRMIFKESPPAEIIDLLRKTITKQVSDE